MIASVDNKESDSIDEEHMDKQLEECQVELQKANEEQGIGKKILSKMNSLPLPLKVLAWLVFAPNGFNFFLLYLFGKYITPVLAKATFLRTPIFLLGLKVTGGLALAFLLKKFVLKDKLERMAKRITLPYAR